jgi:ribosomal 50S subunit-recycling heat shock protein
LRLDLFLKNVCLAKSRSLASKGIDEGRILLNGSKVKASREVKPGDVIEITLGGFKRSLKVIDVPAKQVSKAAARDFYDVLDEIRILDEPW